MSEWQFGMIQFLIYLNAVERKRKSEHAIQETFNSRSEHSKNFSLIYQHTIVEYIGIGQRFPGHHDAHGSPLKVVEQGSCHVSSLRSPVFHIGKHILDGGMVLRPKATRRCHFRIDDTKKKKNWTNARVKCAFQPTPALKIKITHISFDKK